MQSLCQRFLRSVSLRSAVLTNLKNDASILDQVSRRYHSLSSFRSTLGSSSICMNAKPPTTKSIIPGLVSSSLTSSRSVVSLQNHANSCSRLLNFRRVKRTGLSDFTRTKTSLARMHRLGPHIKKRPPRKPLDGNPFLKGIVLRTLIKKPKKPNSANRKCVLVKLSNGKEKVAYVPGVGHNLQEHNVVLVRVGRLRDVPGVKIKCVRGVYDLPHVQKGKK